MERRQLLAPADDIASNALLLVQTATTHVKEFVTEGVSRGWKETELTSKLNASISAECRKVANAELREQLRKSLVTAAKKWHYELTMTFRALDGNLARQMQKQPLDIDVNDLLRQTPFEKLAEFRKILDDGTSPGIPVIKDYQRSVKLAIKAISAEPPKVVTVRNNRSYVMPVRLRAELAVRYAAAVDNLQHLIDNGIAFCWISSHPNCSPRCAKFQGRLYSLFQNKIVLNGKEYGERGTINGIPYSPINEALAGPDGDGNGCISGYNCRHRAIEYQPGSKPPVDYSDEEMKLAYAIDKKQRAYENQIRQLKTEERQLRACGMTKEASALRKQWRRLTIDYQIYSIENDRAYYPYRYVIDSAEMPQVSEGSVDNSLESGIIGREEKNLYSFDLIKGSHSVDTDTKSSNPHYNEGREYRINCQRCCPTYEMRRRGYNVEALPNNGSKSDPIMLNGGWQRVFKDAKWEKVGDAHINSTIKNIIALMKSFGVGARAEIYVRWKGKKSAHVFMCENVNGEIKFIDPQTGSNNCIKYFESIMPSNTLIARLDTLEATDLIKECCKNGVS